MAANKYHVGMLTFYIDKGAKALEKMFQDKKKQSQLHGQKRISELRNEMVTHAFAIAAEIGHMKDPEFNPDMSPEQLAHRLSGDRAQYEALRKAWTAQKIIFVADLYYTALITMESDLPAEYQKDWVKPPPSADHQTVRYLSKLGFHDSLENVGVPINDKQKWADLK
jgi:hypothetical protein